MVEGELASDRTRLETSPSATARSCGLRSPPRAPTAPGRGVRGAVARGRHRVLVTTGVVVAVCAVGAAVIALTSSGGDDTAARSVRPSAGDATTTTGAGPGVRRSAAPGARDPRQGSERRWRSRRQRPRAAPESTQQVTSWTSGATTIEQRWPADTDVAARLTGSHPDSSDSLSSSAETQATVEKNGVAHRAVVFTFDPRRPAARTSRPPSTGRDVQAVEAVTDGLIAAPFVSNEPLVTTTGAAAQPRPRSSPATGRVRAAVPRSRLSATPSQRRDVRPACRRARSLPAGVEGARAHGLPGAAHRRRLGRLREGRRGPRGHDRARRADPAGWTVADWRASGC